MNSSLLNPVKASCGVCGKKSIGVSTVLGVCVDCVREKFDLALPFINQAHRKAREKFGLPASPPKKEGGVECSLCVNECSMGAGDVSYCGLRRNEDGRLKTACSMDAALLHAYKDPLPTNCCSSWFCPGSRETGCNLAVFFHGCSFDCLFCQNWSHKEMPSNPIQVEDFVELALQDDVKCVCYFGGSPEPQLPFALKASEKIISKSGNKKKVCWEWNGSGEKKMAEKAAKQSLESNGNVKFDLKAFDGGLSLALSGVSNRRTLENFGLIAGKYFDKRDTPVLTAATLLVPGYVDGVEVGKIAEFISSYSPDIPYSLLAFHPDFMMHDMPLTGLKQAGECLKAAEKYLNNVNIGNKHLLYLK
jgi:pyruvate formate lyase activating enzyme